MAELAETLDATYERTLLAINKQTREYARRLFQCLIISIRPLRVEELAELFAILPKRDTTPTFNMGWRPDDPEEFILTVCSTLVTIVVTGGKKVVQFSHFSVREYLTSDRIANSASVSHFHVLPRPAHTLLAKACLSVLFQLDYGLDEAKIQKFPFASYAAEHWVDHARFEDVTSDIRDGMDYLFCKDKPHLAAWIWLYDVENSRRRYHHSSCPTQPDTVPLYYAALYGFCDLSSRLLDAYPQDVNARGGYHEAPLHAAIDKGHLDVVLLLLERGADVGSRGRLRQTPLYLASSSGYAEIVRSLIDRGADVNAECDAEGDTFETEKWTALLIASKNGQLESARVLLDHGADGNYKDSRGRSPLDFASRHVSSDLAHLLLDRGANLNAMNTWGETALHHASSKGRTVVVMLLLENGAKVDVRSKWEWTPLHEAANKGHAEVVRLLLDYGADGNARTELGWTVLHLAACGGHLQVVEFLLEHGADANANDDEGKTPLQRARKRGHMQVAGLLSERTDELEITGYPDFLFRQPPRPRLNISLTKVLAEVGNSH